MADQKLTQLTEDTAPSPTDLLYSVKDPSGSPLSRKITHETLYKSFLSTVTEKTVASGVLTVDKNIHKIQPQSGTSDDIDTVTGMPTNSEILLFVTDDGTDTLTFKHGTGNLSCPGGDDMALSEGYVRLYSDGTTVYVSGGGGGGGSALAVSAITPTTANVTAAVNTRYNADVSGLTANRNFIIPAGTTGDFIELNIKVGDDAFDLIVIGDTGITINGGVAAATSPHLYTLGQTIQLLATSSSNWEIIMMPIDCQDGQMINGTIVPSVSSNDLIVAIKTWSGNDPKPSDPVWVGINGKTRALTATTNITLADGTNWFNSGSAELGTLEVDYFAYFVWDSNSTIVALSIARHAFGRTVNATDFSATTTNEKHLYNYGNFTVGDDIVVIGRFAATLSLAGTSHLWTVPTFTNLNLVQHPIDRTRVLSFTPTWTNLTITSGTGVYWYQRIGRRIIGGVSFVFGASSSIGGSVTHTMPHGRSATYGATVNHPNYVCRLFDASAAPAFAGLTNMSTATVMTIVAQLASGTYLQQALMSSTIPFTWTTSDQIAYEFDYLAD